MKLYRALLQAMAQAAALLLAAVVIAVCWDVLSRNVGVKSAPWIGDLTEYSLPLATLLVAPWLLSRGEHVRLDVLQNTLSPAALARIDRISGALGLVVCAAIAWYGIRVMRDSAGVGSLVMKSVVFPEWWVYIPVPICFGLMAVECAIRLVRGAEAPGPDGKSHG